MISKIMNKLFDNRFWYIGFTSAEFNNTDYEKNPCVIIRNPFGKWTPYHEKNDSFNYQKHCQEEAAKTDEPKKS